MPRSSLRAALLFRFVTHILAEKLLSFGASEDQHEKRMQGMRMATKKQMHLGVFSHGTGNHIAGWRLAGAGANGEDLEIFKGIAKACERGKLDFMFVGDQAACLVEGHPGSAAKFEPTTLHSALAMVTTHLGLIGTSSSTFNEPYNVARQFASLDHISKGRAGWNVVTTASDEAAANFGQALPPHEVRYERAEEFVEIVLGLWDSWEEGARVAKRETGQYLDKTKIHALDHKGKFFSVRGPLNSSRTPQGRPVVVQAGSSRDGQKFAARYAELVFTVQQNKEEAREFRAAMHRQMTEFGRVPEDCKILVGLMPIVGRTNAEAREKLAHLMQFVDSTSAIKTMSERFGTDMSPFPLDGPVPDIPLDGNMQSFAKVALSEARRKNYKLRDLYNNMAVARGYLVVCGSSDEVADEMESWVSEGAADGFMLIPATFPQAFDDFIDLVVPELQLRGIFRKEYRGKLLRENLGLAIPPNRYSSK
jgi:N-acetyl-S-(2-succino)cysteine monooxygenase